MDGGASCISEGCKCSAVSAANPGGAESEDNVVSGCRLDEPGLKSSSERMSLNLSASQSILVTLDVWSLRRQSRVKSMCPSNCVDPMP